MSLDRTTTTKSVSDDHRELIKQGPWNIQTLENRESKIFDVSLDRVFVYDQHWEFLLNQTSRLHQAVNFASHKALIEQYLAGVSGSKKVVAFGSHIFVEGTGPMVAVIENLEIRLQPRSQPWGKDWEILLATH